MREHSGSPSSLVASLVSNRALIARMTRRDVIARYRRMLGNEVFYPMGWDSFGLPAENAAIKKNIPPAKFTYDNIDTKVCA